MKIVNVVLSILILLLAIASAVFSYLLFEKRGQLVGGWEKLAVAVNKTAAELDRNSGTSLASELTPEALGHDQFDSLDSRLGKVNELAKQVITERNTLADALFRIGNMVEMPNLSGKEAAFANINTYLTNKDDVINAVGGAINKRNALIDRMVAAARKVDSRSTLDAGKLKKGDFSGFENFDRRLAEIGGRDRTFETKTRELGRILEIGDDELAFDTNQACENSLRKVVDKLSRLRGDLKNQENKIASQQKEISSLQGTVLERDGRITALQKTVDTKQTQINEFKIVLGIDSSVELPARWQEGSADARRAVCARVVQVSEKFGYVTINMGAMSTVTQKIGNREFDVNPKLENGTELVVARGDIESPELQFIGRIKLTQVDSNCSIADLVSEVRPIRVGDIVFFDTESLK